MGLKYKFDVPKLDISLNKISFYVKLHIFS